MVKNGLPSRFRVASGMPSPSSATAMSTGVKTYNGYIGMDVNGTPQWHLMQEAVAKGKAAGVVTSVDGEDVTVVVPQPTCGYILKKDYVDYVGGPDAELVSDVAQEGQTGRQGQREAVQETSRYCAVAHE